MSVDREYEAAMDTARRLAFRVPVIRIDTETHRTVNGTVSRIEAARQNMPEVDYLALVAAALKGCQS